MLALKDSNVETQTRNRKSNSDCVWSEGKSIPEMNERVEVLNLG